MMTRVTTRNLVGRGHDVHRQTRTNNPDKPEIAAGSSPEPDAPALEYNPAVP